MVLRFADRQDAGRHLAQELIARAPWLGDDDVVVLGLPRGGVPVAAVVAHALAAPLDVILVRKLGVPWQPELAMGAIGEDGIEVLDARVIRLTGVTPDDLRTVREVETAHLAERRAELRASHPRLPLEGRTAVVVDDGLATGSTARAACRVARQRGAAGVVLAVPVAASDTTSAFIDADTVVCVKAVTDLGSVGEHYDDFSPTSERDVLRLLDEAAARTGGGRGRDCDR